MKAPINRVHTTWKARWLIEAALALTLFGMLIRETSLIVVGLTALVSLALLYISFRRQLTLLQSRLHAVLSLSRSNVRLGQTIDGQLIIHNSSEKVAYISRLRFAGGEHFRLKLGAPLLPVEINRHTAWAAKFTITPLHAGKRPVSGFGLTVTDARRLFDGKAALSAAVEVNVQLGIATPAGLPLSPMALYAGGPMQILKVHSGVDFAGVREYSPGDEQYRIEWKRTARHGTLMVKEFHPETQRTLRILIDTQRTMHEPAYVATRLEEAAAVAELIVDAYEGTGTPVDVYLYDETNAKSLRAPTKGELAEAIQKSAMPKKTLATGGFATRPILSLAPPEHVTSKAFAYVRLLKARLLGALRKAGLYKALSSASKAESEPFILILSDLQNDSSPLVEFTAGTRLKIVLCQIGARWRLSHDLEGAYSEYQRNNSVAQRMRHYGIDVLDLRPEFAVQRILEEIRESG